MADASTAPRPTNLDDGLVHVACEHDQYTAFCGAPSSPAEEVDDDVDCEACLGIEDLYDALGVCCETEVIDG